MLAERSGPSVVLTSDRASFSDYSRSSALGYFCCLPSRLIPRFLMDHLFSPPVDTDGRLEALTAPYSLRKVEAALWSKGCSDVAVVPPENLARAVGPQTRVVGVTAHDPFGLSPVSTKLTMLFGGGPSWTETFFQELGTQITALRSRSGFRTVVGGPGVWQMDYHRPPWIDTVFHGEAEIDFPSVVRSMVGGAPAPPVVQGRPPALEEIPRIVKAARIGEVQVTRGCPRGCQFCSITPDTFRSIPLELIEQEILVNRAVGETNVEMLTDDILLYGSRRLRTNHEAVVELFRRIKRTGAVQIGFAHISAPAIRESPETIREMGRIAEWDRRRGLTPVIGLETGSLRVLRKYMPAKSFPFRPEEWGDTIRCATLTLNDVGIDPCYTMTVGFPDETDRDVDESIALVEMLIGQGVRAFLFPLPVIPVSTSRLGGGTMPQLESLPPRYWDLLQICWDHDLRLARDMLPSLVGRMRSSIARRITTYFVERLAPHIARLFEEFRASRGRAAYRYQNVSLRGIGGGLRSAMWLIEARRPPRGTPALHLPTAGSSRQGEVGASPAVLGGSTLEEVGAYVVHAPPAPSRAGRR